MGESASLDNATRSLGQIATTWMMGDGEWHELPDLKVSLRRYLLGGDGMHDNVMISVVHYGPGAVVPVHSHNVDYCSIVVAGSIEVTRRRYETGSMRIVRANTAYGPLDVGPDGCTVIDVFAGGGTDTPVETNFVTRSGT